MTTDIGDQTRLYSPRLGLSGDRYRLFRKSTRWSADGPKQVTGEFANKRDRLSKMLTRATRDLSVTTNTPQGYKNTTQYGGHAENFAAESGGSTYRSAEISFYIDDDAVILDAKLRFVITGYRTYERDTASSGSSAPTSGASTASTTDSGAEHFHYFGNYQAEESSGGTTKRYGANPYPLQFWLDTTTSNHNDLTTGGEVATNHTHGMAHTHSVTIASHTHGQTYDIFEDTSAPGAITVKLDGVNINSLIFGPFTVELGHVTDVSLSGIIQNPGWHTLRFETASGKGRITPYVLIKSLQLQPS